MASIIYHDSIKNSIIEQLAQDRSNEKRKMEKREIKRRINDVRDRYLSNSKIKTDELSKILSNFKNNWQEFIEQARFFKKPDNIAQFRRYQV
ncbi:MAG: hypothetical protein NVSMB66_2690 [Candidatus Doudnabacteria bacterium]